MWFLGTGKHMNSSGDTGQQSEMGLGQMPLSILHVKLTYLKQSDCHGKKSEDERLTTNY